MEFFRQEYWSGLPFLSPGDLPDPGIEFKSPADIYLKIPTQNITSKKAVDGFSSLWESGLELTSIKLDPEDQSHCSCDNHGPSWCWFNSAHRLFCVSLVWWSLIGADFSPSILATSREKILLLSVLKYQSREVLCLTFPGHVPEKRWGITDKGGGGEQA